MTFKVEEYSLQNLALKMLVIFKSFRKIRSSKQQV